MIISFCVSEGRSKKVSDRGACSALPASGALMASATLMGAEADAVGGGELISVLLGSCHCDQGPLSETMAMGVALLLLACFNDGIVWMGEVEVGLVEGPPGRSGSYDPPVTTADFKRSPSCQQGFRNFSKMKYGI